MQCRCISRCVTSSPLPLLVDGGGRLRWAATRAKKEMPSTALLQPLTARAAGASVRQWTQQLRASLRVAGRAQEDEQILLTIRPLLPRCS